MIGLRLSLSSLQRLALVALVCTATACSSFVPDSKVTVSHTGDRPAPMAIPEGVDPDDAVIGLREHPKIIASFGGVYQDRPAEIMLAKIVGRLLAAANQPNLKFTVTILDSGDVNAFALPGGYVYVTRGILALASDSSELAAVLAHEIAHVTLRHARARSNRTRTTQLVDRVVTGVFGESVKTDQSAARSRQSLAAFSQNQELEADREGIRIAGTAGYDPTAASRFLGAMGRFAKFAAGQSQQGDDFLSSHPSTPDRVQKATESARSLFSGPATWETDRDGYMAGIAGLSFGTSPTQGSIIGQRFVQPGAKFTFTVPKGYDLQNSQSAVVGVAGDGEAVRFDSAEVPASVPLVDYLKSGWIAGLKPETVQQQSFNGIDMATGVAKTDQWSFRVSVMRFDGAVYRFIFAAKADSQRFADGAEATLKSFRRADARDLSQVRSVAVKIVTAKPGDTADSLARQMGAQPRGADLFYVLNNLLPGDPVKPGAKYKIVAVQ
jgi:predicted Zn-dependent protease